MSSFSLLKVNGCKKFVVEQVDLNVWILPGIFRRDVVYCDIGVYCRLSEDFEDDNLEFKVNLPFRADASSEKDLIPLMENNEAICGLVFGTTNLKRHVEDGGVWLESDDGGARFKLMSLENGVNSLNLAEQTNILSSSKQSSILHISTAKLRLKKDDRIYLRFRVSTHSPNCLWMWQKGAGSHSHAVCDMRFNEFREVRPEADINLSKVFELGKVNGFVISSAKLRTTRISPTPKYIRVLENDSWTKYLGRKLSRSGELFIITYWSDTGIDKKSPYRAFIELEKRTPTATKMIFSSTIMLAIFFASILPESLIKESILGVVLKNAWEAICVFCSLLALRMSPMIFKYIPNFLRGAAKVPRLLLSIEKYWYKI